MNENNILTAKYQQRDNSTSSNFDPDHDYYLSLTARQLRLLKKDLRIIGDEVSKTEAVADELHDTLDESEGFVEESKEKLGQLEEHDTETRERLRDIVALEKHNRETRKRQATVEGQLLRLRTRIRKQRRILKSHLKQLERSKKQCWKTSSKK